MGWKERLQTKLLTFHFVAEDGDNPILTDIDTGEQSTVPDDGFKQPKPTVACAALSVQRLFSFSCPILIHLAA